MSVILCAESDIHAALLNNLSYMNDEREQFSRRLKAALRQAGYPVRPGVLHKLFNSRYSGPSVSTQTVSRWMAGKAIPEQDKLQVLASLLGVSPHYLRFGNVENNPALSEARPAWAGELNAMQWQVLQSYLALSGGQQSLVGNLIDELARLNDSLADGKDKLSLPS